MTEEEWGPWIEHDHSPCPVSVGEWVAVEFYGIWRGRPIIEGRITPEMTKALDWTRTTPCDPRAPMVIRYRIRKPKALQHLREIAENVKEDA